MYSRIEECNVANHSCNMTNITCQQPSAWHCRMASAQSPVINAHPFFLVPCNFKTMMLRTWHHLIIEYFQFRIIWSFIAENLQLYIIKVLEWSVSNCLSLQQLYGKSWSITGRTVVLERSFYRPWRVAKRWCWCMPCAGSPVQSWPRLHFEPLALLGESVCSGTPTWRERERERERERGESIRGTLYRLHICDEWKIKEVKVLKICQQITILCWL